MTESLLLKPEESARIDAALMTSRDKFATRVAVYALRMLQQMNAIDRPLSAAEIRQWLQQSEASKALILEQGLEWDDQFLGFWTQLIDSAQRSLLTIATDLQVPWLDLSLEAIVAWFEAEAKAKIDALPK
ncbi:MAG: hypothetical protein RLZZ435_2590 [Cyanobacteriota bacterium]